VASLEHDELIQSIVFASIRMCKYNPLTRRKQYDERRDGFQGEPLITRVLGVASDEDE